MHKTIFVLALIGATLPVLNGCIPLVIGGVAATALVAEDRRSPGTYLDDEAIELKAVQATTAKYRDNSHINVTSYNRNVLLTGEAATEAIRADVEKIVRGITNVRNVNNELVVAGNSSLASRSSDALVTSKVKGRFVSENKFQANQVKVVTENGVVYLLGIVTPQEADEAAQIASTTTGVLKVVKVFEYSDTPKSNRQKVEADAPPKK